MTSTKARVYRVYLRAWDIFAHDVPAISNEQAIELARAEFDKSGFRRFKHKASGVDNLDTEILRDRGAS